METDGNYASGWICTYMCTQSSFFCCRLKLSHRVIYRPTGPVLFVNFIHVVEEDEGWQPGIEGGRDLIRSSVREKTRQEVGFQELKLEHDCNHPGGNVRQFKFFKVCSNIMFTLQQVFSLYQAWVKIGVYVDTRSINTV